MDLPAVPARDAVVVAGGSGVVGGAVVAALARRGSRVVVPSRRPGAPGDLPDGAAWVPVARWDEPDAVVDAARAAGASAVVAALGGWWRGVDLVDLAPAAWRDLLESHLTAHLLAARALAPALVGPDPAYVLLNGAASREAMAGSGPVSVTGAAQRMLLDVLRAEAVGRRVRFHEVTVLRAVAGDERNVAPEATVTRGQVVDAVLGVLDDPGSPAVVEVEAVR